MLTPILKNMGNLGCPNKRRWGNWCVPFFHKFKLRLVWLICGLSYLWRLEIYLEEGREQGRVELFIYLGGRGGSYFLRRWRLVFLKYNVLCYAGEFAQYSYRTKPFYQTARTVPDILYKFRWRYNLTVRWYTSYNIVGYII